MIEGWDIKKLGDITLLQGGSQPPKSTFKYDPSDGYIRLLQIRDFKSDDKAVYIPFDKKNKICKEDDILIGRYGASVGKICTGKSGAYNVALMKATPNEELIRKYYLYYLKSDFFQKKLISVSARGAQNGFNKEGIYDFDVPVPPIHEQKEIVEILDKAFESIEKAKANIEKNIQNAKELFQSKLNHIFSQTGDDWNQVSIESLCNKTKNINWKENTDREFDYIDLSSVSRTSLTVTETKKIDSKNAPSRAKKIVKENDIIFGTTRPTLKRATKINEKYNNQICSTGFVVLSPKDPNDSEWIFYFLLSNKFMKRMESLQRGASYPAVSDNDVKKSILSIPSKESIKTQMIENLDALDNHIQSVLLAYNEELKNLEELKKSILQKAFSGELTNKNKAA